MAPQLGLSSLKRIETSSMDFCEANGYIVFGSASNIEDQLNWQRELAHFMKDKILQNIPVLGICFGHQLIADSFGCKVDKNEKGVSHRGVREITFLSDGFGFKKEEKRTLFKYHSYEVKEITEDFIHLATSEECQYDALALKNYPYLGFQGHPEASQNFVLNDIKVTLEDNLFEKGQQDGKAIIRNFIKLVDSNN